MDADSVPRQHHPDSRVGAKERAQLGKERLSLLSENLPVQRPSFFPTEFKGTVHTPIKVSGIQVTCLF